MTKHKTIAHLQQTIRTFSNDRNWDQFHNAKDLSISLSIEAAELLEHFQWKTEIEIAEHLKSHKDEVGSELADVLYWVLLTANKLDIDLTSAFDQKMVINESKYPIAKARGNHKKYTEL